MDSQDICRNRVRILKSCLENGGDKNKVMKKAEVFLSLKNCNFCDYNLRCEFRDSLGALSYGYNLV